MYKKSRINGGLRLVTYHMPHMDSAAIGIWVGVGGRYESDKEKGIAHFLEHLSFKGSKNYSAKKIKETIEGYGGSLNAFTSEEFTCYITKILAKHIGLAIDILSDMVLSPKLLEKDLEKEKTVILEEIKMYHDLPQYHVHELLDELLWPGHPLGMNLAGSLESVSSINRDQLKSFHKRFYRPIDMVISLCGNIEHQKVAAKLSKLFSCGDKKVKEAFKKARITQSRARSKLLHKDTEQSHLAMGYLSFRRNHPDRHAVGLLNIILGANMSSRLFNEVREKKGLAYEIGTQTRRFYDTGAFLINAGVDNRKVMLAISTILKEMEKIKKTTVSKNEFFRAKEYYTGQLLMGLEDTLDHMLWIGEQEAALGEVKSAKEVLLEINKVTPTDLKRVAKEIFRDDRFSLALIGPQNQKEQAAISRILN